MQKKKSVAVNIKNAKTLNLKRFIYTCNNEHDINIFVDNITLRFYDVHTQILTLTHIHLDYNVSLTGCYFLSKNSFCVM